MFSEQLVQQRTLYAQTARPCFTPLSRELFRNSTKESLFLGQTAHSLLWETVNINVMSVSTTTESERWGDIVGSGFWNKTAQYTVLRKIKSSDQVVWVAAGCDLLKKYVFKCSGERSQGQCERKRKASSIIPIYPLPRGRHLMTLFWSKPFHISTHTENCCCWQASNGGTVGPSSVVPTPWAQFRTVAYMFAHI